jgi:crotonobetainyl-CoA:carnitine CoA-transferase CaiB-like acyl-CoA transferase
MARLPLDGVRIISHGIVYTGTAAATMLGDMGCEVIRVESIQRFPAWTRGAVARPPKGQPAYFGYADNEAGERPWERFYSFHAMNRNQYGITLDLGRPKGVALYKRLVKVSDIVLENLAPGVMDRLGIGYSVVKEVRPDIIMVSASGLGIEGPYKGYSTFGTNIGAIAGMMGLRGYRGDDMRVRNPAPVWSDNVAAGTLAFAALTALYYRQRTGKGQFIDLSQAETILPHMGEAIMDYTMNNRVAKPMGNRDPAMAPHGCYRCQGDDRWVTIAVSSDQEWQALCEAMGEPVWIREERFAGMAGRLAHQDELDGLIGEWTAKRDPYEVMHLLQKVGVPAGAVVTPSDLCSDPHLEERGFFTEVTHREAGTHRYPGMCFKFSKTPMDIRIPPNCLGEHNEYVYGEILGMSREEIAELEREQLIGDTYLPTVP